MATPTKATGRRGTGRARDRNTVTHDNAQTNSEAPAATDESTTADGLASRSADESGHRSTTIRHPRMAAERVARRNSTQVSVPLLGMIRLPAADGLAFLGGMGVLVVVGVIDWPIGAALGVGHLLATNHHAKVLREFGEALETAG
jgi:hypothetical protein